MMEKKKREKKISMGIAHISVTFNNTIITITDIYGTVIAWSSAGHNGFKGSKKSTPYAAQITAEYVAKKTIAFGIKTITVKIQGPGTGRDSAIRGLILAGLNINIIQDITPIPHNGCRPPKRRRV